MDDGAGHYSRFFGASCTVPSSWGLLNVRSASFTAAVDGDLVITIGEGLKAASPLVRIHSECVFAEALNSMLCDCAEQLDMALTQMRNEGQGVLFYLRLDGRGAGLAAKVAATALEVDEGLDTYESRLRIGVSPDGRNYSAIGRYLKQEGVTRLRLLTNNPDKAGDIAEHVPEVAVEPLRVPKPNPFVEQLYETKSAKFRHST